MRTFGKRECPRCGTEMTTFCPSVETFSSIGNDLVGNRDALEKKIATLEDVAVEVVREYMDHRMFPKCEDVFGICPHCGGKLATRAAQQCLNCHTSWHSR